MSFTKLGGKFPPKSPIKSRMSALALTLTQRDAEHAVAGALQRVFGFGRRAARKIRSAANCNERTALGWVTGESTPDFVHTLRLVASVPEFAAEVRRLTGLHADIDPVFQRDFIRLMQTYATWKDNAEALATMVRENDAAASPARSRSVERRSVATDQAGGEVDGAAETLTKEGPSK